MRVTPKTLKDVAFFLDSVTPDMTPAKWGQFCKAANKRKLLSPLFRIPAFTEWVTLAEAQALRAEIARDLSYWDKNPQAPFARLISSLNRLELKTKYVCPPVGFYGKTRPGQAILKVGNNRFVPRVFPEAKTPKELLYVTLGVALIDGTLDRVKKCSQCGKWTMGKAGRKFCPSSNCKDAFHNAARLKKNPEFFKDYMRDSRAAHKAADIKARGKL